MNAEFPRFEQPTDPRQPGLSDDELGQIRTGSDGYPIYRPVNCAAADTASASSEVRPAEAAPDVDQVQQFEDDGGPATYGI